MLQDPSASLADKQTALRFVVHIVGDLHQPLHVGKCCDRGGNEVKVTYFGKPTNLHSVWDTMLVDDEKLSFSELADKLERHTTPQQVIDWWDINPRDWISESGELRDTLYPTAADMPKPDKAKANRGRNPRSRRFPISPTATSLSLHAADGAAAEPGRRPARRLSQRHFRRAAADRASIPRDRPLMLRRIAPLLALSALAGCATTPRVAPPATPIEVQILAINDFHGNIETPPDPVKVTQPDGSVVTARMGGAAQLASALASGAAGHANTITVAAGDLIGASPLASAYFLDEPTIDAMNMLGLSLASVGNHEFDKGSAELLRMQAGGCGKNTSRMPCRLEPFAGARFEYLAGNVVRADGSTMFPATAIRQVGPIKIGFIGETLKETGTRGHSGRRRRASLCGRGSDRKRAGARSSRRPGADAIVLLIHQGGKLPDGLCRARLQRACPATSCRSSTGSTRRSPPSSPAIRTKPMPARSRRAARRAC